MKLLVPLVIVVTAMLICTGTAHAQLGGTTFSMFMSFGEDCYSFTNGPGGPFTSNVRGAGTTRWNEGTGIGGGPVNTYVFAGNSDFAIAYGGGGLVVSNFLILAATEVDENGATATGVGIRNPNCTTALADGGGAPGTQ